MGKWGKYLKHYNPAWEKEAALKGWLQPASEEDVLHGKQEAYCKYCEVFLRAHHRDLMVHKGTKKHERKEKSLVRSEQPSLHDYGCFQVSDVSKVADLKLAMYIALHCSIRSIDHLGELLKVIGKGSPLEQIRLHRTKCSKLISAVVAPEYLAELLEDIGDSPYSLIVDEATDVSTSKFMGICVRYFSVKRREFVTDFLGLVPVTDCTGKRLADATKEYLKSIGLPLKNLTSVGTDGAPAMCGIHNSFYTHMKQDVPQLLLFKCVCHSLDKCGEYAYKKVPDHLKFILSQAHNWFSHSSQKWDEYKAYYKALNDGKEPRKLISLSKTRWLVWVPASEMILSQWTELKGFFGLHTKDFVASELARLMNDKSNQLYLVMMKTILKPVQRVNLAFEHTNADVTKLYSDLRTLVFSLANRILKPETIAQTSRPGVLRDDEVKMLKRALENGENHLPIDRIVFGDTFQQLLSVSNLLPEEVHTLRDACAMFMISLCYQLVERLPSNLATIGKLKFLSPRLALARLGKPTFQQLPIELVDPSVDREVLENQWLELGQVSLSDICHHPEINSNIDQMDINHFWACVLNCKTAAGEQPFKELALFALKVLTLPISNAVVERLFSVMSFVKSKHRNKFQIIMLSAILRARVHLKVFNKCCVDFEPSKKMLARFNSNMYLSLREGPATVQEVPLDLNEDLEDEDYQEIITIFDPEGASCVLNI